jgi:HEPN domain-containing protein
VELLAKGENKQMDKDENIENNTPKKIVSLGYFDFAGKGPGTYSCGVVKLNGNREKDLLDSAESFLKAADRCLNGLKIETGIEILTNPGTVCAALSCELFLKYILIKEKGKAVTGHKLDVLFKKCNTELQALLIERKPEILEILERNREQFLDARYHHENNEFSFREQEVFQTAEFFSKFVREKYSDNGT